MAWALMTPMPIANTMEMSMIFLKVKLRNDLFKQNWILYLKRFTAPYTSVSRLQNEVPYNLQPILEKVYIFKDK